MKEYTEDVRVVGPRDTRPLDYLDDHRERQRRSDAQRMQDEILDKATEHAETALEHVHKALDWLTVVTQPKHRSVPVYVQQLVEEIAETRRVKQ